MNHKVQTLRGIVQIMATGILLIGFTNSIALAWAVFKNRTETIKAVYPGEITMALPTAIALAMTGACLIIISYRPRVRTKWFREEAHE